MIILIIQIINLIIVYIFIKFYINSILLFVLKIIIIFCKFKLLKQANKRRALSGVGVLSQASQAPAGHENPSQLLLWPLNGRSEATGPFSHKHCPHFRWRWLPRTPTVP